MSWIRQSGGFGGWRRSLATLALAGTALVALPPANAMASHWSGGPRLSRGSLFGSSRFGIHFGGRNFGFSFGTSRFYGYRPFTSTIYTYPYYINPFYYGLGYYGGYYGSPYGSIFAPSYGYTAPRPQTIYVYPPPIVRNYPGSETAPRAQERERETPDRDRPRHPYDELVSPTPEKGSAEGVLAHIRTAWLTEDLEVLTAHLPKGEVALYRDDRPRQDLTVDEFRRLNRDAFRAIRTLSFRFTEVRHPAADETTATAVHTYVTEGADEKEAQSATLRYDLVRQGDIWTLRAVHVLDGE